MLTKVKVTKEVEVELNPGDVVILDGYNTTGIRRLVETYNNTYAVFHNETWRPLSTYGKTWRKKEK